MAVLSGRAVAQETAEEEAERKALAESAFRLAVTNNQVSLAFVHLVDVIDNLQEKVAALEEKVNTSAKKKATSKKKGDDEADAE